MLLTPVTLSGRRVTLEPLLAAHAPDLAAAAAEDRSSYRFTWVPDGLADAERYVSAALGHQATGRALPWVIRRNADGRIVGTTRLWDLEVLAWLPPGPLPAGERLPTVGEIGSTWLAASAQGSGVNAEAKLLLLGLAFDTWRSLRVVFTTDARNTASRTALERLGARLEDVRRDDSPALDGSVRDVACYSILTTEWPDVRAGITAQLSRHTG